MAEAEVEERELPFTPYNVDVGPPRVVHLPGASLKVQWRVEYTVCVDDVMHELDNLRSEHTNRIGPNPQANPQEADPGGTQAPLGREVVHVEEGLNQEMEMPGAEEDNVYDVEIGPSELVWRDGAALAKWSVEYVVHLEDVLRGLRRQVQTRAAPEPPHLPRRAAAANTPPAANAVGERHLECKTQ
mmetsp:Transcript_28672/g.63374  ORF Transcript_28672/g.63374 Transcript_28672/m.63374 type:complete len:186 (-) Transcript_28672:45-602(-)